MKLDVYGQRSLLYLLLLLPFLCHEVAANTEIINFASSREQTVDLPLDVVGNWSMLHAADNERRWTLEPAALHTPLHQVCERSDTPVAPQSPPSCPHELWLFLDLDDAQWASYSAFTLRLSWPASTPADFAITLYSPQDLFARLSERGLISTTPTPAPTPTSVQGRGRATDPSSSPHTTTTTTTRSRYARIRAVDAGVPTPNLRSHPSPPSRPTPPQQQQQQPPHVAPNAPNIPRPLHHHSNGDGGPADEAVDERGKGRSVPFVMILEPLYVGVLPATLLPTVGFLIPIVLTAVLSVPSIITYLESFAQQAREDLKAGLTRTRKER